MAASVIMAGEKPLPSWSEKGQKTDIHLIIIPTVVYIFKRYKIPTRFMVKVSARMEGFTERFLEKWSNNLTS